MPLNNLGKFDPRTNQSVPRENSIANFPKDQMAAFARNIANANISAACSQSTSVLDKQIRFKVNDQELRLRIKEPVKELKKNRDLLIFWKDIEDTIDLSAPLPATLQKSEECTTILSLLKASFPKLTSLSLFPKEIPRFVVSSLIPLNQEGKGNFFPQIESEGQIAYIAWDSSGSQIAKGFKEKTCDILLKNKEAFCGVGLSQANLEGIEEGAGVSAHFMTSKVTVIGILIESPVPTQSSSWWLSDGRVTDDRRIACDSDSDEDNLGCDVPTGVISRGPSSRNIDTTFGMLGVQGASVSSNSPNLWDRPKKPRETLHPFCLEIVPQFSSEETPVHEKDLEIAVDMQFQKKAFRDLSKS
ncbi:hypothetical protein RHABOEDO_000582 [Candidatus Rhabdochlamydia oedothoracis]|uniref:Uncharacterized protein n=1 Tax=Candidatus Rhabdochlamydia oedothoracis TaxID=2720720 RepID=A0ABX8V0K9_9BACT|nr:MULTISPECIES: hypothetical protein [Rhabdochlamydia]KAG6559212.1 hypothetical protein RHOW815_000777 [Candidatus Rhabdochlamydia sp. W815]QYF48421.1 hypothetical protein RHABOEDO_000582 [Candidatus Rhabdochlamydia oedothoracis]